jgi:hypothetical protein
MRSVTRKKKISYPYGLQRKFKNGNAQGRTSDAVVKIRRGTRDSTLSFHLPLLFFLFFIFSPPAVHGRGRRLRTETSHTGRAALSWPRVDELRRSLLASVIVGGRGAPSPAAWPAAVPCRMGGHTDHSPAARSGGRPSSFPTLRPGSRGGAHRSGHGGSRWSKRCWSTRGSGTPPAADGELHGGCALLHGRGQAPRRPTVVMIPSDGS